jgi:hypothetical protein
LKLSAEQIEMAVHGGSIKIPIEHGDVDDADGGDKNMKVVRETSFTFKQEDEKYRTICSGNGLCNPTDEGRDGRMRYLLNREDTYNEMCGEYKNWSFACFSCSPDEYNELLHNGENFQYLIMSRDRFSFDHESKYPHVFGYVQMKYPVSLNFVTSLNERMLWEPAQLCGKMSRIFLCQQSGDYKEVGVLDADLSGNRSMHNLSEVYEEALDLCLRGWDFRSVCERVGDWYSEYHAMVRQMVVMMRRERKRYRNRRIRMMDIENLWGWQRVAKDLLEEQDDASILFVVDKSRASLGKSYLAAYLKMMYENDCMLISGGRTRDMRENWLGQRFVVVDLTPRPRNFLGVDWKSLCRLKTGSFECAKENERLRSGRSGCSKTVVFMNEDPDYDALWKELSPRVLRLEKRLWDSVYRKDYGVDAIWSVDGKKYDSVDKYFNSKKKKSFYRVSSTVVPNPHSPAKQICMETDGDNSVGACGGPEDWPNSTAATTTTTAALERPLRIEI